MNLITATHEAHQQYVDKLSARLEGCSQELATIARRKYSNADADYQRAADLRAEIRDIEATLRFL